MALEPLQSPPILDEDLWGEDASARPPLLEPSIVDDPTARDAKRSLVYRQCSEVWPRGHIELKDCIWVTCPCNRRLDVRMAYKCLFCGVWLCAECAHRHFASGEGIPIDLERSST